MLSIFFGAAAGVAASNWILAEARSFLNSLASFLAPSISNTLSAPPASVNAEYSLFTFIVSLSGIITALYSANPSSFLVSWNINELLPSCNVTFSCLLSLPPVYNCSIALVLVVLSTSTCTLNLSPACIFSGIDRSDI